MRSRSTRATPRCLVCCRSPRSVDRPRQVRRVRAVRPAVVVAWNLFPTLLRRCAAGQVCRSARRASPADPGAGRRRVRRGRVRLSRRLGLREIRVRHPWRTARSQAITAALQAGLIVLLTTALLLVPAVSGRRPGTGCARWRDRREGASTFVVRRPARDARGFGDRRRATRTPGTASHRTRPTTPGSRARSDRSLSQPVAALSRTGGHRRCRRCSLAAVLTAVASPVEQPPPADGGQSTRLAGVERVRRLWRWIVVHIDRATPLCQAGFFFTLQTLSRRVSHRAADGHRAGLSAWRSIVSPPLAADRLDRQRPRFDSRRDSCGPDRCCLDSVLIGFRYATRVPRVAPGHAVPSASPGRAMPGPYHLRRQTRRPGSRWSSRRSSGVAILARGRSSVRVWRRSIFGVGLASSVLVHRERCFSATGTCRS